MKLLFALACAAALAILGCDKSAEQSPTPAKAVKVDGTPRFLVKSHGTFCAGYCGHEREILIVTDTQTKREYLAITGVGVTELFMNDKTPTEE